ncbi:MAG TPA: ABC transporter permease [Blastocatellia bacterium]|nr:ABC transporter permease [Blastocatellia bacterium]
MRLLRLIWSRCYGFLFRNRLDRDMEDEIQFHLMMRTSVNVASGLEVADARRAAIRRFGRMDIVREYCRDIKGGGMIDTLLKDLRFAGRMLAKNPGFTIVAVATLALGIGANTAIFSMVNAALFRPLPYPESDRLVVSNQDLSPPDFLDVQAQAHVFEQMATYRSRAYSMSGRERAERIDGADVTTNLFSLLRVKPLLGRVFGPGDAGHAVDRAVILSYSLWQTHFGASRAVLGQTVTLDAQPFTIVGVMPPGFEMPATAQLWVSPRYSVPEHPLRPDENPGLDRGAHYFDDVIARLKPVVTLQNARADLDTVAGQIVREHPDSDMQPNHPSLEFLHDQAVSNVRPTLLVIFGVVTLVFLIACANVANLMLSRGIARRKELAIRAVLGAGRARIVRQLLTESVLLATIGGALGVLVAFLGFALLAALAVKIPGVVARPEIDGTVLVFTAGLSLLAALFFGLAPAFQGSHTRLAESVNEGGRSSVGGRSRYQEALVGIEVALAVVLLTGAGLLLRSFMGLLAVNTGFDSGHVLTLSILLPQSQYPKPESKVLFMENILKGIDAVPGVKAASVVSRLPLNPGNSTRSIQIEGRSYSQASSEPILPDYIVVSPGYFGTIGIPVQAGRDFTARDSAGGAQVAIISKAAAETYWPNENPIGKRLLAGGTALREVVGIVGDVSQHQIGIPPRPALYLPHAQDPWPSATVVVKTAMEPASMATSIEQAIWAVDKDQGIARVWTMDEVVSRSVSPQKLNMMVVGLFAGLALVLAAIGIFGVTSFAVSQRKHEIGVRVALGASRSDVLRLILGRSLSLTVAGTVLGVAGAAGLTRLMSTMLFGVHTTDPITLASVPLLLIGATFVASFLPARRAMSVDPAIALRYE